MPTPFPSRQPAPTSWTGAAKTTTEAVRVVASAYAWRTPLADRVHLVAAILPHIITLPL